MLYMVITLEVYLECRLFYRIGEFHWNLKLRNWNLFRKLFNRVFSFFFSFAYLCPLGLLLWLLFVHQSPITTSCVFLLDFLFVCVLPSSFRSLSFYLKFRIHSPCSRSMHGEIKKNEISNQMESQP